MNERNITVQQVLEVLNTLYSNNDDSIKQEANKYLEQFQKKVRLFLFIVSI